MRRSRTVHAAVSAADACESALGCSVAFCLAGIVYFDCLVLAEGRVGLPRPDVETEALVLTGQQGKLTLAETSPDFKDCPIGCPVMVVVPEGTFMMGSAERELHRNLSEGPLHE